MASSTRSNRWLRIEYLFYAALELESGRTAFLDEACGSDTELRQEVESLLRSEGKTMGFLHKPVLEEMQGITGEGDLAGKRIGAYQLLRVIGEGGMGKVYLAARADDLYRKEVAIKTLQGELGHNRAMLLRFRSERQILANLDHPNIARLLDGGVTEEGLPYLVMEYVNGIRADDYCRINKLGTDQRLQLFSTVCAAVEYAHKNLVVHRDIKPANILVTAEGVPKLLDFGVAKLLDPEFGDLAQTRTTERMMTLEYASPEQINGNAVTTSTDVYALGVLLFELLVGKRPFSLGATSPFELARRICEQEPQAPSVMSADNPGLATPDAARTLSGDLDNIVMMAMRKEPARRYVSVSALASDVKAYLTGYPIHARTDTWKYRSGKFVRRHKAGVSATVIVAVALIGSSVAMGLLAKRATQERRTAQREAQFLKGIFEAATPEQSRGQQITARELLDQGAKRVDRELASDPELQGTMLDTIGHAYSTLGLYDQAEPLLERAYGLRSKTSDSADVADTLFNLATSIRMQGQYKKAEPFFRRSLALNEKNLGEHNTTVDENLSALGECLYLENKDSDAEPVLRKALALDRELNYDSFSRNYLALLLKREGRYPEALQLLRELVEYDRQHTGADSPDYALALHNLGGALIDAGDLTSAESTERQVIELQRKIFGENHPNLAYPLNKLGLLLLDKGDTQDAEPLLRESLELRRKTIGENSSMFGVSLGSWGRLLQQEGHHDEAEKTFKQALEIVTKANGPADWTTASLIENLGVLQFDREDYAGAERYARQTLDIAHQLNGDKSPQAVAALIDLANAKTYAGDAASAEPLLREAVGIRKKQFSAGHPSVIGAEVRLGDVLTAEGKAAEAEPVLREALASAQAAPFPLLPWQVAEVRSALGTCLVALGHLAEGEPLLRASQPDLEKDPRPAFRHPRRLSAH